MAMFERRKREKEWIGQRTDNKIKKVIGEDGWSTSLSAWLECLMVANIISK